MGSGSGAAWRSHFWDHFCSRFSTRDALPGTAAVTGIWVPVLLAGLAGGAAHPCFPHGTQQPDTWVHHLLPVKMSCGVASQQVLEEEEEEDEGEPTSFDRRGGLPSQSQRGFNSSRNPMAVAVGGSFRWQAGERCQRAQEVVSATVRGQALPTELGPPGGPASGTADAHTC